MRMKAPQMPSDIESPMKAMPAAAAEGAVASKEKIAKKMRAFARRANKAVSPLVPG
ncbi:hypothetical protein D3C83_211840 [compost metagenome]